MTPKRVQELRSGDGWMDAETVDPADFRDLGVAALTWGELRALLDAYGKTCEWHVDDGPGGCWLTSCGAVRCAKQRHCSNCGGKVVTR